MRCGPAGHARSMTIRLPPSLSARCARRRPTQHTGRSAPWLESPDFHTRRSAGSGRRSWPAAASARRPSSFRAIRSSSTRSAILSASTCRHRPTGRWSSVSMRKARFQALDREQPVLPMMLGVPERRTHAYIRHGTTSLFAALDVASGFVIGKYYKRHRATEFLDFLKRIDAQVPNGLDVHIIMDNYATHKTAAIKAWLARRPHYHAHFTPTSALSGSTRSDAGSPNSPARSSGAASIPRPVSSKPISAPSSSATMKTPGPISASNPPTRFSLLRQAILPEGRTDIMWRTLDSRG